MGLRLSEMSARTRFVGTAFLTALALAVPQAARAEAPVNQCTGAAETPSSAGGGQGGFTPGPDLSAPQPLGSAPNLGAVSPKTGAFTYSSEDLSVGFGAFPAKLSLVRSYSSDRDGGNSQDAEPLMPYEPGVRAPLPFGRGATHNLDIRYEESRQSFSGPVYSVVVIKMGLQSRVFQKCADGTLRSVSQDGSRLFNDSTYPNGGYRYESRDGDVLLFQRLDVANGTYYCNIRAKCGILRKWTATNGDWAQFDYEQFYSHPTNRAEASFSGNMTNPVYNSAAVVECHPNFSGASECHGRMFATSYTTIEQGLPPITNFPVYNMRLTGVSNSRGYKLQFQYVDPTIDIGGVCGSSGAVLNCSPQRNGALDRNRIQSVTGYWVSPSGQSTQLSQATYGYANCEGFASDCLSSATGPDGRTTQYAMQFSSSFSSMLIYPPGYTTPITTVNFTTANSSYYYPDHIRGFYPLTKQFQYYFIVSSQSFADGTSVQYVPTISNKWVGEAYGTWDWPNYISSMQVIAPGSATTTYNYVDLADDHDSPVSVTNPLGAVTTNTYSPTAALLTATLPEGNRTQFSYDVRGNLLSTTRYPKPGTPGSLSETYTYNTGPTIDALSCANLLLCNRPVSRVDARGFETDYSWDGATGLLLSETSPADSSGVRPTTSYSYGSFLGAGSSTVRLLSTKTQQIDPTRNQVTTFGYDADTRLAVRESTLVANGATLRTCYKFDAAGNLISKTNPRAGLGSCP